MAIVTTMDVGYGHVSREAYVRVLRAGILSAGKTRYVTVDMEIWPDKTSRNYAYLRDYINQHVWTPEEIAQINTMFPGTTVDSKPAQTYNMQFAEEIVPEFAQLVEGLVNGDIRPVLYDLIKEGSLKQLRFCDQVERGIEPLVIVDDLSSREDVIAEFIAQYPVLARE